MNQTTFVVILIAVLVIALAAFLYSQRQRSRRLKTKFGPEYDRLVKQGVDPRKAEAKLASREKRVEKLHIHELTARDVDRFSESWRSLQARFVDSPREAVVEADHLVRDMMTKRGYPMTDFEQRAAFISVDHPRLVENYRLAHAIAVKDEAAEATTEDLRQAMVHYRHLFEDLLSCKSRPKNGRGEKMMTQESKTGVAL